LRSCSSPSSPSSSGAISGSNGFEAVSNGWYSLAIKPEKMRERERGEETQGKEKDRTGENFGPSTSSKSSCFYHHCLRLERRRLGRNANKKEKPRKGGNHKNERKKREPGIEGDQK